MKPGFSSLELIMAMTISAIIMTSLLEIYNQVTRNMIRVERFVFEDTQILTLKNRLGKDLSGLSAIWFTQQAIEDKQAAADGKKVENATQGSEKKKAANYFYSINKNGKLDILTFITTSALQSFGKAQDQFVRVVYQVEADLQQEGMFRLMRKEIFMPTENIDEQALKQGMFYELVSGIKSLEMTYQLIDKVALKKQQEKSKDASQVDNQKSQDVQESKPIIRSVKQWGLVESATDKKNNEKKSPEADDTQEEQEDLGGAAVPKFVAMNIVFGATDKQFEKKYTLEFCIPSTVDNVPKGMLVIKKPAKPAPTGGQ